MSWRAAKLRHGAQFLCGPDPARGVLRGAEDQDLHGWIDNGLRRVEIQHIAVPVSRHGDLERAPFAALRLELEFMVDRREEARAFTGFGKGLQHHGDGVAQTLRRHDPVGINRPAMVRGLPPADGVAVALIVKPVAKDAVVDHALQRLDDRRCGAEIAIRHAHRDPLVRVHAADLLQHVPLVAMGAAAIEGLVKLGHGYPFLSAGDPSLSFGDRKGP
jgi:hypothetical protein